MVIGVCVLIILNCVVGIGPNGSIHFPRIAFFDTLDTQTLLFVSCLGMGFFVA